MKRKTFLRIAVGAVLGMASAGVSVADTVLLTIAGAGGADPVELTESQLLALPQIVYQTETIWTVGEQTFSGPSLKSVMELVGVSGKDVSLTAVNDYTVQMPAAAIEDGAAMVALRRNGSAFGVRDKGPLWIVFPYDDDPTYQTEAYYSYSIWQLTDITVAN